MVNLLGRVDTPLFPRSNNINMVTDRVFIRRILQRDKDDPDAVVNITNSWLHDVFYQIFYSNQLSTTININDEQYNAVRFIFKIHIMQQLLELYGNGIINKNEYIESHSLILSAN